jgi:hypothetical protein
MDEAAWGTDAGAVKDQSGRANDGTAMGTAAPTPAGKFGGAASLDGSGWINVPDSPSLHVSTAVTFAAWIYPTGLTDGSHAPGIITKRRGLQDNVAFTLFLWTANEAWVDIASTRFASNSVFANGAWYHVAVVYDGNATDSNTRVRLYVNGTLDKQLTADPQIPLNLEDIHVGDLPEGGSAFIGKIDEVAIWTRALSPAEVLALATASGPL